VGLAVADGGHTLGHIPCAQGDVLYCALEDGPRRLQSRITKLYGISRDWPNMSYYCMGEVPRLNAGGLDMIRDWIKSARNPRLVIIDTFQTVRAPKKNGEPHYEADYESGKALQALANEYCIAIVIVHHLRKADADDVFDTVSGTLGLTGVVDSILVLKRDVGAGGSYTLHGRGRDLESF
jgi:predicted ATP-dependent serine protease